jgi:hypothetical protein
MSSSLPLAEVRAAGMGTAAALSGTLITEMIFKEKMDGALF